VIYLVSIKKYSHKRDGNSEHVGNLFNRIYIYDLIYNTSKIYNIQTFEIFLAATTASFTQI